MAEPMKCPAAFAADTNHSTDVQKHVRFRFTKTIFNH